MEWFDHVDVTPPFSHGEWIVGKLQLMSFSFLTRNRFVGVKETEVPYYQACLNYDCLELKQAI